VYLSLRPGSGDQSTELYILNRQRAAENLQRLLPCANVSVFVHVGLCPDWQDWNPANNVQNAGEAMDAAEQWLDVPQV